MRCKAGECLQQASARACPGPPLHCFWTAPLALNRSGPVGGVLPHFEGLGFVCPTRKDPGSFLQARAACCGNYVTLCRRCTCLRLLTSGGPLLSVPGAQEVTTPAGQWLYASKELLSEHGLTGGQPGG